MLMPIIGLFVGFLAEKRVLLVQNLFDRNYPSKTQVLSLPDGRKSRVEEV